MLFQVEEIDASFGCFLLLDQTFFLILLKIVYFQDTMNSWLHGTSDLFPGTSMHSESMNVSSFLAGLGPDCLTTHTWSRLKAALSVHKKKKGKA